MTFDILLFGITKDIIGDSPYTLDIEEATVGDLRKKLMTDFPKLEGLKSLLIAVNSEYATDDILLKKNDEIALIPPVSGG